MTDSAVDRSVACRNRILAAMPEAEFDRVRPSLTRVDMTHGSVLFAADEPITSVYFPLTGVVSLIAEAPDGQSTDVAVVGNEGFVGLPVFLGTMQIPMKAVAQVPGTALRMSVREFSSALAYGGELHPILMRYTQMRMVEMGQTILCNRVHDVAERTARWLLQLDERVDEAPFELTQEFFATMLGTSRPSVTIAVGHLRDRSLIDYSRGVVEIVDRERLEAVACPCYRIIRDELDRLLAAEPVASR